MANENEKALAAYGKILIDDFVPIKSLGVQCADILLAQSTENEETKKYYLEYFEKKHVDIFTDTEKQLLDCKQVQENPGESGISAGKHIDCCLNAGCISLYGIRGSAEYAIVKKYVSAVPKEKIKRLFIGDLVWLYWMDRLGLFKLFAILVNDYGVAGKFPIKNDVLTSESDLTSVILEVMCRQSKMGFASSVRERASAYRRCLGWETPESRSLSVRSEVNTAFNKLFHTFIKNALTFYEEMRLASAIKDATTGTASAATEVAVAESLQLLVESFDPFRYGRNYFITLNGIVYAIATINLVRVLSGDIGIPVTYNKPKQYISSAYSLLVEGKPATQYKPNRFMQYSDLAIHARSILLDIEAMVINGDINDNTEAIGNWLENNLIEKKIESYRAAYKGLFGIDLAKDIDNIEQQV